MLFCLAEDVLSRHISNLVLSGQLEAIKTPNNFNILSLSFYADDILLFCKGKLSNIKTLPNAFMEYSLAPSQFINCDKSSIFGGAMSTSIMNILMDFSGFKAGSLSFSYLGVPIFKGCPKDFHLQSIVDKIINKLASWKGSLLSFAVRVEDYSKYAHTFHVS